MVVSSRQEESAAPPVVVLVVTPRTTLMDPPALSTGVTPPRISWSNSLSSYRWDRPDRPKSSAPPRGRAGSVSPAMAPATAAATDSSEAASPSSSTPPGATSTTRSQFRASARSIRSATLSAAAPATTAMRSRRFSEAWITLSRSLPCTVSSVLSQMTTATSSTAARVWKALSYPAALDTGTAATPKAPLRRASRISSVMFWPLAAPKAVTARS